MMDNSDEKIFISNYVAVFIDLLGQKDELEGCGLLPKLKNSEDKEEFLSKVKKTIGAVNKLQTSCQEMFDAFSDTTYCSEHLVPSEKKDAFKELMKSNIKFQRWSDGFVAYISLNSEESKVPMGDVFGLLATCGSLCLLSLAKEQPIRGGLEVAWGAEINPDELYGCVVAKAYDLESKVAQYPRIVVGANFIDYLQVHTQTKETDDYSVFSQHMALCCMEMLAEDDDGHYFVDYLGEGFNKYVAKDMIGNVSKMAYDFVIQQSHKWQQEKNTKLAFRYAQLKTYFKNRLNISND